MLDRAQLLCQIARYSDHLFCDTSVEYNLARCAWQRLVNDSCLSNQLALLPVFYGLPSFSEPIDTVVSVVPSPGHYSVMSVDGSQIYPDRHCGFSCYLINIGVITLSYGNNGRPFFKAVPYVFSNYAETHEAWDASPEMVNGHRQELELQTGLEINHIDVEHKKILLFDGSLIFWHLERKDTALKKIFFARYLAILHQLSQSQIINASYVSMPRSRELVNMLRWVLADLDPARFETVSALYRITDTSVVEFFLKPGQRTTVFKNNSTINNEYLSHIVTYFFYLHVGNEIGRVEIPAWIAHDQALTDFVASAIVDQCHKGRGYPIALAEAHEQAVVKGADRDFFYHALHKLGIEKKQRLVLSQKSIKKRGMPI